MPPKKSNNSKKKKAAGPVRGYGTVSVPRKKDPIAEEPEPTPEEGSTVEVAEEEVKGGKEGEEKKVDGTKEEGSWDDPVEVEKRELQNLAERIRPGCDKEINRIVKVRDGDRRIQ